MEAHQVRGLGAAAGAALAFGVMYAPVKRYEIFDGATFQWFMCSGILMGGFAIAVLTGDLERHGCPLQVVLGGALWALSNFFVLPLVKLLGVGPGFSLYHFVNLVVGYLVGRFGLFGVPQPGGNHLACDGGCGLILLSFVAMVFVETDADGGGAVLPICSSRSGDGVQAVGSLPSEGLVPPVPRRCASEPANLGRQAALSGRFGGPLLDCSQAIHETTGNQPPDAVGGWSAAASRGHPCRRRFVGIGLALVSGGLCGVQTVPATLYTQGHDISPTVVVFPQCVGIWAASSLIYLLYASAAKLVGWRVPHATIRPACASGVIWSFGFLLMIVGIRDLGYSVCYSLDAAGPIMVSSLLSLLVFREVSGTAHVALYCVAFLLQLSGVVVIATFGRAGPAATQGGG